jgi:hypothetical protein
MNDVQAAKNEFGMALNMARASLGDDCPAKEYYRNMARGMMHLATALDVIYAKLEKMDTPPKPGNIVPTHQVSTGGFTRR